MNISFTKFPSNTNWVEGKVKNYNFKAYLFDDPSSYGIENGRISKLSIYDDKKRRLGGDFINTCIVHFDRGWDKKPRTKEDKAVFQKVYKFLEASPTRFN